MATIQTVSAKAKIVNEYREADQSAKNDLLDKEQRFSEAERYITKDDRNKFKTKILDQLKNTPTGKENGVDKVFENICKRILEVTMYGDFYEHYVISNTDEKRDKYGDIYAQIPDLEVPVSRPRPPRNDEEFCFWMSDEITKQTNHLVFDCKNYKEKIDAKEIYQVFHYLNSETGVGKIGFILCRNGGIGGQATIAIEKLRSLVSPYHVLIVQETEIKELLNCYVEYGRSGIFFMKKWDKHHRNERVKGSSLTTSHS